MIAIVMSALPIAATALLLGGGAGLSDPATFAPGTYCFVEDIANSTTGDALGQFEAQAVVRAGEDGRLVLQFTDYFPDSDQRLAIGPVAVGPDLAQRRTFAFTDNWNVAGTGSIAATANGIHVELERTGDTDDGWARNAGRNYGAFDLTKEACEKLEALEERGAAK